MTLNAEQGASVDAVVGRTATGKPRMSATFLAESMTLPPPRAIIKSEEDSLPREARRVISRVEASPLKWAWVTLKDAAVRLSMRDLPADLRSLMLVCCV